MKITLRTVSIVLIIILLTALTTTSALADPAVPAGLVGLWTFEEGSGTAVNDVSGVAPAMNLAIEDATHTTWSPAGALTMGGGATTATILGEGVGDADGVLDSLAAGKIAASMRATNEFTIEAWVTAAGTTVSGPARVVNLTDPAAPTGNRNFSLLQDTTIWDFRLRWSGGPTSPGDWNPVGTAVSAGTPTLLVVTYDASGGAGTGTGTMYVLDPSSCPATPTGHVETTTGGDLSNWSDDYRFSMGNETNFGQPPASGTAEVNRDWRGELHMVALYNQALTPAQIATRCTEGSRQIFDPLTITKAFAPNPVEPGQTSTLTFDIGNPAGNPATSGVAFTDTLPGSVVVAAGVPTNTCGGLLTAPAAGNSIALTGGTLAAGGTCQITVPVASPSTGNFVNTSGVISSVQTQDSAAGASDTLNVAVAALTLGKAYAPPLIEPDGVDLTTLTFTLGNPNALVSADGVAFSDTLNANLSLSNLQNTCGGTPSLAGQTVSLTGASIAAGGSCTVSVDVTSTVIGVYPNGPITATSTTIPTSLGASASLNVFSGLALAKVYDGTKIYPNKLSTLTFTLANAGANPAATNVSFSDTLDPALTLSNLVSTCTGAATLVGQDISLTGATLAPGGTCTITVDVTGTALGTYPNTTSAITSDSVPDGPAASATLMIIARPASRAEDLEPDLTIAGTGTATGNTVNWSWQVCNIGDAVTPGLSVRFDAESTLTFVSSVPAGTVDGQTLWVPLAPLQAGACAQISIETTYSGSTADLGSSLRAKPVRGAALQETLVCMDGSVADAASTACAVVGGAAAAGLPASLPQTGGSPVAQASSLLWGALIAALLAGAGLLGLVVRKRLA